MLYKQEDIESINKLMERNEKLEKFFISRRQFWSEKLEPLINSINFELKRESSKEILNMQSLALSYKQNMLDEQSSLMDKLAKADAKVKKTKGEKFIYFATNFGVKTNTGEKTLLIEAQISEEIRNMEIIQNYIEFLRGSIKNIETLQYAIKNIIDLFNYLSKN